MLRHAIAVLILPVTVVVAVPVWIGSSVGTTVGLPESVLGWGGVLVGIGCLVMGAGLFCLSLFRFGSDGRGTLAPWDPPSRLVVTGPYAFVRNPMISGVILLLVAEGLILRSSAHLLWAGGFSFLNALYIPILEEPMLRARFGREYEVYAKAVRRLLPRLRPWRPSSPATLPDTVDRR